MSPCKELVSSVPEENAKGRLNSFTVVYDDKALYKTVSINLNLKKDPAIFLQRYSCYYNFCCRSIQYCYSLAFEVKSGLSIDGVSSFNCDQTLLSSSLIYLFY